MGKTLEIKAVIDPILNSYRSFFDHRWSQRILKAADSTRFEMPVFLLLTTWKSIANTSLLPWLMMDSLRSLREGYLSGQEDDPMVVRALEAIPGHLCRNMPSLSRKQKAEIATRCKRTTTQIRKYMRTHPPTIDVNALWDSYAVNPPCEEFRIAIWGSQRLCYGALYHGYENFLRQCVDIALGHSTPHFYRANVLAAKIREKFGDAIHDSCLADERVDTARQVRNSLAHNGGLVPAEIHDRQHGFDVEDNYLQVKPVNTHGLFDVLKIKAYELTEAAIAKFPS
jgi:hypothetical protein